MNTALALLTLALVAGLALAPTAAASCPPNVHPIGLCPPIPVGDAVGCLIDRTGDFVGEIVTDCL